MNTFIEQFHFLRICHLILLTLTIIQVEAEKKTLIHRNVYKISIQKSEKVNKNHAISNSNILSQVN